MEERLREAEQQKTSLRKQIDDFLNEEHTQTGQAAQVQQTPPSTTKPQTMHINFFQLQRALRDETDRHQSEVNALQKQITQLTNDIQSQSKLHSTLTSEINDLTESLRASKRNEQSLSNELTSLRQRMYSRDSDGEYARKLAAENAEFKNQIDELQHRLDGVGAQRDRLTKEVAGLQGQLNDTRMETLHFQDVEREFGSVRAERDDLRKS